MCSTRLGERFDACDAAGRRVYPDLRIEAEIEALGGGIPHRLLSAALRPTTPPAALKRMRSEAGLLAPAPLAESGAMSLLTLTTPKGGSSALLIARITLSLGQTRTRRHGWDHRMRS